MPTPVQDKYYLRTLHQEIALFDRKLAHLLRYETFPSEKERIAAAAKMSVKRGQLVDTALKLVKDGVEFSPNDLPQSMRIEGQDPIALSSADTPSGSEQPDAAASQPVSAASVTRSSSFQEEIREYLANRKRSRQN